MSRSHWDPIWLGIDWTIFETRSFFSSGVAKICWHFFGQHTRALDLVHVEVALRSHLARDRLNDLWNQIFLLQRSRQNMLTLFWSTYTSTRPHSNQNAELIELLPGPVWPVYAEAPHKTYKHHLERDPARDSAPRVALRLACHSEHSLTSSKRMDYYEYWT
jgi:hypothetical protein